MSIENSLKRIADALEALVANQGIVADLPGEEETPKKAPAKKAASKKAPAKKTGTSKKTTAKKEEKKEEKKDESKKLTLKGDVRPVMKQLRADVGPEAVKTILSKYGATTLQQSGDRWINCPGSVNATRGIQDESSEFAAEGSFAHLIAEMARDQDKPAKDFIGWSCTMDGFKFTCDKSMADYVQQFIDYVNQFDCDENLNEGRVI
jgi:hypothetical protein